MSIKERRERIDDLRARQEIARMEGKTGAISAGNVIFYLIVAVLIVGLIMWLTWSRAQDDTHTTKLYS